MILKLGLVTTKFAWACDTWTTHVSTSLPLAYCLHCLHRDFVPVGLVWDHFYWYPFEHARGYAQRSCLPGHSWPWLWSVWVAAVLHLINWWHCQSALVHEVDTFTCTLCPTPLQFGSNSMLTDILASWSQQLWLPLVSCTWVCLFDFVVTVFCSAWLLHLYHKCNNYYCCLATW